MIIVTGGAGFIGSNLVAALEAQGKCVVVSDWLGKGDKWLNLAKRDLQDIVAPEALPAYLEENQRDIEAIFNMGAISTTTETDADLIIDNNFRLSCTLWNWCAAAQIPFIYASSAATYGSGANGFVDDESISGLAKLCPLNAYGWSKHLFDRWVAQQKKAGGKTPAQYVGLKFFNVYGPNEYHKGGQRSVVDQVYPFAARGDTFQLFKSHNPNYADGGQLRDFIWVGDCVKAMMWFFENRNISGLYNMGTGKARSFADLATAVYSAAGKAPKIEYRDMPVELQGKYQYFTEADMTKLRATGYKAPFTSLEDGVRMYVQSFLAASDKYL